MDRKSRRKAAREGKKDGAVPPIPPPTSPHPPGSATPGSNEPPDELTPQQRQFVEEYVAQPNATRAYMRAFKCTVYTTAGREGYQLKKTPKIAAEIAAAQKEQQRRTRITADRTLREIARIAFADTIDLFDDDERLLPISKVPIETRRAIQSVKVRRTKLFANREQIGEEDVIEVKLAAKDPALGRLMKHLGLDKEGVPIDAFLALLPDGLRRQLAEAYAAANAKPDVPAKDGGGTDAADPDGEDS